MEIRGSNVYDICKCKTMQELGYDEEFQNQIRNMVNGASSKCDIYVSEGNGCPEYFERYLSSCIYGAISVGILWLKKEKNEKTKTV